MKLVFLLEDDSMKAFLESLLPRILPVGAQPPVLIPHEGRSDLEKSIPRKLRAFRDPAVQFVVLRDQDSGDCRRIKQNLRDLCTAAGRPDTLIRIACRELESWYVADLAAIDRIYGTTVQKQQEKNKYRYPDRLGSPSQELRKLVPQFQKLRGAAQLGREVDLENPRSTSFAHLISALTALVR